MIIKMLMYLNMKERERLIIGIFIFIFVETREEYYYKIYYEDSCNYFITRCINYVRNVLKTYPPKWFLCFCFGERSVFTRSWCVFESEGIYLLP